MDRNYNRDGTNHELDAPDESQISLVNRMGIGRVGAMSVTFIFVGMALCTFLFYILQGMQRGETVIVGVTGNGSRDPSNVWIAIAFMAVMGFACCGIGLGLMLGPIRRAWLESKANTTDETHGKVAMHKPPAQDVSPAEAGPLPRNDQPG